VTICARPPLTTTAAARKPAAKRAASAESFTALGTHTYCQIAEPLNRDPRGAGASNTVAPCATLAWP
jgi:hypothetical protein